MNGTIYFIRAGREGPIKIGWTASPRSVGRRLSTLQIGCPDRLALVGLRPGSKADEAALHKQFAECRIGGEWFWASHALLREVGVNLDWPEDWEEVLTNRASYEDRTRADILLEAFLLHIGYTKEELPFLKEGSDHIPGSALERFRAEEAALLG